MGTYDFKTQPSVVIQGAMDVETEYLIGQLRDRECITLGNWTFYTGFLGAGGTPVIVSKTFQGMVNAAAATSLAMVFFAPAAVINQGIGGGHDPKLHVGDIVIGTSVAPMGAMMRPFAAAGAGIGDADFSPLGLEVFNREWGEARKLTDFSCSEALVRVAEETAEKFLSEEKQAGGTKRRIVRGVLGSADEWNNQLDRITLLRERFCTAEEDMESAATAQVCAAYGAPFLGIRILSNTIVNGEDYDERVAVIGQRFVVRFAEALAQKIDGTNIRGI